VFDFAALDVALGLIFVYLLLALVCSAVTETLSSMMAWRADTLREGIENLFGSAEVRDRLYSHPIVKGLIRKRQGPLSRIPLLKKLPSLREDRYPSYLPARAVVTALLHPVPEPPAAPAAPGEPQPEGEAAPAPAAGAAEDEPPLEIQELINDQRVAAAIAGIPNVEARNALKILWRISDDPDKFKAGLERWFDDSMARVSGWYRRRVQLVLWIVAAAVTLAIHADSLQIAQTLWRDDATRAAVTARAEKIAEADETPDGDTKYIEELENIGIPLGWGSFPDYTDAWEWWRIVLLNALGLALTAVALTMGAPFWFDLLKKVANIRAAGRAPAEKRVEKPGEAGEPAPG
jgi:hypothetical protein